LIAKLQYQNLRVLWLNGNPVAYNETLTQYVNNKTRIQLFNSKFTKHCTVWGLKFASLKQARAASTTENGKVYTLNLDNRDVFNIDISLFDSFHNLRSLSLRGHLPSNEKEFEALLKIVNIPSLRFLLVD
jgi:hypothetical protein